MKFSIGIPTLNRADLLLPSLRMYSKVDFNNTDIYVIDNGNQKSLLPYDKDGGIFRNVHIMTNDNNIGVAASWNFLCKKIFENSDYAIILNDDIYLKKNEIEICNIILSNKNAFIRATPDWCVFILSREIFEKVGEFDECFFPAYYEDTSYEYRMRLAGVKMVKTPLLNPFIYKSCGTMEKMPELQDMARKNKELYVKMWGGEPSKEKFKTAYNAK